MRIVVAVAIAAILLLLPGCDWLTHLIGTEQDLTVTLADQGRTIQMHVGQRFLLKLGEEYEWTVTVTDPSVLSRVMNIAVVRGAQGVYQAVKTGQASLVASGDPRCRQLQPPCELPSRFFQVQIVVP